MDYVRVVKNSDDLEKIIDIPKGLRNKKVEVIILPYIDIAKEDLVKKEKKLKRSFVKV